MKKMIVFLVLLITLCGCQKIDNNEKFVSEVVYSKNSVNVVTVEKLKEPEVCEKLWAAIDYEDAFVENDVIFQGIIKKITEVKITGLVDGTSSTLYKTIIEVEVSEVIRDVDNTIAGDKTVKVITGVSSREYEEAVTALVENREYLFLTKSISKLENDYYNFIEYSDVFASSPIQYIIPVVDEDMYQVRSFYSELCEKKCEMTNMNDLIKGCSNIQEIKDKIATKTTIEEYDDIVSINNKDIEVKEILFNISNKDYINTNMIETELNSLYLVPSKDFKESIRLYIDTFDK